MKRFLSSVRLTHLALLGIFLLSAARVSPDPDTWWHLNAGKWMVEHGELLRVDQFSYTRLGEPYPAPGWPVQILLYLVYQVGGIGGLNLLTGFVFTLAFYFVSKALSGSDLLKASALLLGAAVSSLHASARPALIHAAVQRNFLVGAGRLPLGARQPSEAAAPIDGCLGQQPRPGIDRLWIGGVVCPGDDEGREAGDEAGDYQPAQEPVHPDPLSAAGRLHQSLRPGAAALPAAGRICPLGSGAAHPGMAVAGFPPLVRPALYLAAAPDHSCDRSQP